MTTKVIMKLFKDKLFTCLKRLNLLPDNIVDIKMLDYGRGLEKQLDEYRELLEAIEKETGYFSSERGRFSIGHAETLDNYLSHCYQIRFDKKPNPSDALTYLRQKPLFINHGIKA